MEDYEQPENTNVLKFEIIEEFIKNNDIKPDVIFVDPPRKGCDKKFIDTIISMKIKKVIYVPKKIVNIVVK